MFSSCRLARLSDGRTCTCCSVLYGTGNDRVVVHYCESRLLKTVQEEWILWPSLTHRRSAKAPGKQSSPSISTELSPITTAGPSHPLSVLRGGMWSRL